MIEIEATEIIRQKIGGLKLGLLQAEAVEAQNIDAMFEQELREVTEFLQRKFATQRPAEDNIVGHVRRMYRRIGWEPTNYRPSSEALIRRILQGKGLYRINNLVDYGNLVSARFHLPMGLYDTAQIVGKIVMDVGGEGESYQGISKEEIHAAGKLILRDEAGIFGNPTADSRRTAITKATTSALAIFFCPPEAAEEYLLQTLDALRQHYLRFSKDGDITQNILRI